MKATELRVGNYIKHPRNKCAIVESIQKSAQGLYALTFVDENAGYWIEHEGDFICEPIPLTEEWLIKLNGNIKDLGNDIFRIGRFKFIWKHSYKYWYVVDDMTGAYMTKIEFVHEYQNFWYAMNSQELQLKAEAEKQ